MKKLQWALPASLVAMIAVFTGAYFNWPFEKPRVQQMLKDHSGREVRIGAFQKTYFPPGFIAEDVEFLGHIHIEQDSPIRIGRLVVKGSWVRLLAFSKTVPQMDIYNLSLQIPPRGVSADGKVHRLLTPKPGIARLDVITALVHHATLNFLPGEAAAKKGHLRPYRLMVREMVLSQVKDHSGLEFETVVENSLPQGDVHAKGRFGPWDSSDPGRTPVKATYTFQNARLAQLPGIAGTLQAKGKFWGTLDREETEGDLTVPDFRVTQSTHNQNLHVLFRAVVDATEGNVELRQVDALFGKTTVHAQGTISDEGHPEGKMTILKASISNGRVEDLEKMFMYSKLPPVLGFISLQTAVRLPSGKAKFLERLEMTGDFQTASGKFTNPQTQDFVNRLKESAQGENKKEQDANGETVPSQLHSHVVVKGGSARLENLLFEAPGTMARMDGTFNLISREIDIKGTLKTDGKLSDTQDGLKAFAAKLVTPFFKKKHATVVPFRIKGVYGQVAPRLDLGAHRKL